MGFLGKLLKRFHHDQRGVFAVIFGVLALVLVATSGAVVDFVGIQNARGLAQSSLDSATLALHSEIDNLSENEIRALAQSLLSERMATLNLATTVETVKIDKDEGTLFMEAKLTYPTTFLSMVGISNISARLHTEVTSKSLNIEVALVLDSTGSMNGRKMTALKSSANLLVNELMPEAENPGISLALVPFNRYVNVGMNNRNLEGLDIPEDYQWTPPGEHCWNTYPNDTRRCDRRRVTRTCYNDGVPYSCQRWEYYNCTGSRGEPVRVCRPNYARNFRWYGCMASRHIVPLDTVDVDYDTDPVPGVMRHWNTCKVTPITELTSTRQNIRDGISAMRARDNTYIPTGLMWGWRLLSPGVPFANPHNFGGSNKKIIVLMTDGANTLSPRLSWSFRDGHNHHTHRGGNTNLANSNTVELCQNIKGDNIIVYTIAFEVSDDAIRTILSNCAGNGGRYFDATDAASLQDAFAEIADDLQSLRLSL